jgi:hypothetical protein
MYPITIYVKIKVCGGLIDHALIYQCSRHLCPNGLLVYAVGFVTFPPEFLDVSLHLDIMLTYDRAFSVRIAFGIRMFEYVIINGMGDSLLTESGDNKHDE